MLLCFSVNGVRHLNIFYVAVTKLLFNIVILQHIFAFKFCHSQVKRPLINNDILDVIF